MNGGEIYDVGIIVPWGIGAPVNFRHMVHWHVEFPVGGHVASLGKVIV